MRGRRKMMKARQRQGRLRFPLRSAALVLASGIWLGASSGASASLTIHGHFDGSRPPANLAGGGNLEEIFNVAAAYWERAYSDPRDSWTVEIDYGWGPLDFLLGQFYLSTQGGTPHREESGRIVFNNNGNSLFFADPT